MTEQLRRDELSDANNWNQRKSREVSTKESDEETNQCRGDATAMGDESRHPFPANSHASDEQGNRDAVDPRVNVRGHRP